jgi:hypothetical protein
MWEEHRLRMFENRVLREMFSKRDEVIGAWRRLHNEELHGMFSLDIIQVMISRRMRLARHVLRALERDFCGKT